MNFKKSISKNCTCYYFNDIIKIEDFDFDNILLAKSQTKIFWFITCHTKLWLVQNHCILGSLKQMDLLEFMMELDLVFGPEKYDAIYIL